MNKQNAEGGVLTFWAAQYSKRYLACLPFVPASERDVVSENKYTDEISKLQLPLEMYNITIPQTFTFKNN